MLRYKRGREKVVMTGGRNGEGKRGGTKTRDRKKTLGHVGKIG